MVSHVVISPGHLNAIQDSCDPSTVEAAVVALLVVVTDRSAVFLIVLMVVASVAIVAAV
jgi:hypothetical protein